MARISNVSSPTNTSVNLLVQLDQGYNAGNYYIYITCNQTGQQSGDLGYQYSSSNPHWSRSYNFTGLTPGTTYSFSASVSPYVYVQGNSYTTTGSAPQPPQVPLMRMYNASGKNITMVIDNAYNATQLSFKPSWSYYRETFPANWTYYTFTAPDYGGNYVMAVRGQNTNGESQDKLAAVYTQPRVPTIRDLGTSNGSSTIQVSTDGYFTRIDVEMWTAGASSLYQTKSISWNGDTNYIGNLTFGAMVSGATYQFRAIAYKEYNSGYGGWLHVTNKVPPTSPAMRHYQSNGRTITMIIDSYYDATSLQFRPSWTGSWETRSIGQTLYSFTAPSYGTEYTMAAKGINNSGESVVKLSNVMTEPDTPSISGTITNNVASIRVNGGSGGFTELQVEWWNNEATINYSNKTASVSGATITFAGLEPGKTYLFRARALKIASYPGSFAPTSPYGGWLSLKNNVAKPPNWVWTTAANSNGHKIAGVMFSLTASEWNQFTQRINAFREYKGLSPGSFRTAVRGNVVEATLFNAARASIDEMRGTGLGVVAPTNKIFASYFNSLMNGLNGIT